MRLCYRLLSSFAILLASSPSVLNLPNPRPYEFTAPYANFERFSMFFGGNVTFGFLNIGQRPTSGHHRLIQALFTGSALRTQFTQPILFDTFTDEVPT